MLAIFSTAMSSLTATLARCLRSDPSLCLKMSSVSITREPVYDVYVWRARRKAELRRGLHISSCRLKHCCIQTGTTTLLRTIRACPAQAYNVSSSSFNLMQQSRHCGWLRRNSSRFFRRESCAFSITIKNDGSTQGHNGSK